MSREKLSNTENQKGTFILNIKYRRNATWQGEITWIDKKETRKFRSALELVKMIDGALDENFQQGEEEGEDYGSM